MTLHVQTTGNGPHLTLVHGWGLHGGIWQDLVDDLSENWRVTVIDLPGHGMSAMPEDAFTLETLTAEIARVVPQSSALLGWSLGGMISMQLAASHPDRISKLILVASTPQFVRSQDWPHAMDSQVLDAFAEHLTRDFHSTVQQFLTLQVYGSEDERNTLRQLQRLAFSRNTPDPQALQGGLIILAQGNIRPLLAKITCPALLIYGQHDRLVPQAVGKDLLDLLPRATLHVINRAGHAPFLSHPREFYQTITAFLHDHTA